MIRHIVMFKIKEFDTAEAKMAAMKGIKTSLEGLRDKIEVLKHIQVDFNCNPAEAWDLILTTEFESLDDLNLYANHPEHVIIVKQVVAPVKTDRACVDYEY